MVDATNWRGDWHSSLGRLEIVGDQRPHGADTPDTEQFRKTAASSSAAAPAQLSRTPSRWRLPCDGPRLNGLVTEALEDPRLRCFSISHWAFFVAVGGKPW